MRGYGNPRRRPDDARVSSSLTPPAPIIPSGTPRFGAPKREEKEIWRCAFSSSPLARSPLPHLRAVASPPSVVVESVARRDVVSPLARATPPRLPGPKIAPHALFPLLLGAQSWADEPEGEFLASPTASTPSGRAPLHGRLGSQQQQHSVPGGPGLFQAQAPPGGFAEREPPNYSFGVGSPGAVAPGFAVGSPGARGPAPGFGPPGSPRAPVSVARLLRDLRPSPVPPPAATATARRVPRARRCPSRPRRRSPPLWVTSHTSALRMRLSVYSSPTRAPSPTFAWFATATTIAPEDTEFEDVTSLERALKFDQYDLGGRPLPRERRRGADPSVASDTAAGSPTGTRIAAVATVAAAAVSPSDTASPGVGGTVSPAVAVPSVDAKAAAGTRRRAAVEAIVAASTGRGPTPTRLLQRDARSSCSRRAPCPWATPRRSSPRHRPAPSPTRSGAARPVDSSAKLAEAERKIQEEKDAVNAKAGIKSGEVPAPKPKPAAQAPKQHKPKAQLVVAPKEEPHFEAKNAFDLLAIDPGRRGDDGGGEDEEKEE